MKTISCAPFLLGPIELFPASLHLIIDEAFTAVLVFVSQAVKIQNFASFRFREHLEVPEVFVVPTAQCWPHYPIRTFDVSRHHALNDAVLSQFSKQKGGGFVGRKAEARLGTSGKMCVTILVCLLRARHSIIDHQYFAEKWTVGAPVDRTLKLQPPKFTNNLGGWY